jgi:glyoxylate carboligase
MGTFPPSGRRSNRKDQSRRSRALSRRRLRNRRRRQSLKEIHQSLQADSLLRPVTKLSAEVSPPESIAEVMANAFRAAESDRPGAVFVNLPKDIMEGDAKCDLQDVSASPAFGPGSRDPLAEAAKSLIHSVGGGLSVCCSSESYCPTKPGKVSRH